MVDRSVLGVWSGLLAAAAVLVLGVPPTQAAEKSAEEPGYESLFNGEDLSGWDGDERFWSVVDGVIQGKTTPENKAPHNTFLIHQGEKLKDFHLKLKFRILTGNNSGVQYRSKDLGDYRVSGYQAEVQNKPGKVGFLYHERGRGWLVDVGDSMIIDEEGNKHVVGKVSDVEALKQAPYYHNKDWNEYHIIARGNHIVHYLNGYPTMELLDNDPKGRLMEGVLALQIHAGSPMTVQYKDIRLKRIDSEFGEAKRLFNGEDTEGWTFSSPEAAEAWSVRDGALHSAGRPVGYIRTEDDYTNYVLRMQIRHIAKGNSGVLLRIVGPDKVWPRCIEAQGQKGAMGDIWNIGNFPMKADPERTSGRHTTKAHPSNERAVGHWNDYEITLDGPELKIAVNNLVQNRASECWVTPGKIGLQSEGTEIEFRNIVLIPITDAPKKTTPSQ